MISFFPQCLLLFETDGVIAPLRPYFIELDIWFVFRMMQIPNSVCDKYCKYYYIQLQILQF